MPRRRQCVVDRPEEGHRLRDVLNDMPAHHHVGGYVVVLWAVEAAHEGKPPVQPALRANIARVKPDAPVVSPATELFEEVSLATADLHYGLVHHASLLDEMRNKAVYVLLKSG